MYWSGFYREKTQRMYSFYKKKFLSLVYTVGNEYSKNGHLHTREAKSLLSSKPRMTQQLPSSAGVLQGSVWVIGVQFLPKGSRCWHLVSVGYSMTCGCPLRKKLRPAGGHCFFPQTSLSWVIHWLALLTFREGLYQSVNTGMSYNTATGMSPRRF